LLDSGPPSSAQEFGPLRISRPRLVDRIFGALFTVDEQSVGASPAPHFVGSLFGAAGALFSPPFSGAGVEAQTGSLPSGVSGDPGIIGKRGVRLPWVDGTTELLFNLVLGGLLILSLLLLGLSALPPRVIAHTPLSVRGFGDARPYLVACGSSILLTAALLYGLGRVAL
jgi:hypothetical protein